MLPSSQRLRREFFQEIFKKGRFFSGKNLTLMILKETGATGKSSRFSFSVSKKVAKKAVARNKLRRRGYNIVKETIKQIKPGFLAVFVFKTGAAVPSFKELRKEIKTLLQKSKLL